MSRDCAWCRVRILDDLYPGSGIVGRSWRLYTSGSAGVYASLDVEHDASRVTTVTG